MIDVVRGSDIRRAHSVECDVVVVGSGPGGATCAARLAEAGLRVVVVEAGSLFEPAELGGSMLEAMTRLYRHAGAQVTSTMPSMPLVQGVAVGGTSVVNGAISWRLPRDVWSEWIESDPGLEESLSWRRLEEAHDQVERTLGIAPTDSAIAGRNNDLLARGAEELGLEHRPIHRNVSNCLGLGKCLQGCPEGRKASMDRTYLPRAVRHGATILSEVEVVRVRHRRGRATGVDGRSKRGARVRVDAAVGVVVAASALQSPALLQRSGIEDGPVGENFQAHPGVALIGRFQDAVNVWTGATQGHEVIGLRRERLKFEALGYGWAMAVSRLSGLGSDLAAGAREAHRWAHWGAAVRARARGTVRASRLGGLRVSYRLTDEDLRTIRRGVSVLGDLMFAAGAEAIAPHVHGWDAEVTDRADWRRFESSGPLSATAYSPAVTHMFGTCRMGTDPGTSVVGRDFQHHRVGGLWVSDSSVFPSNTGVNPQTSICAMSILCADEIVRSGR